MTSVLVAIHLLAAGIWFGGSTALVFVGVPAVRAIQGEGRGIAMKALGLRWRPLGYGALIVAALTGVALASRDWPDADTAFKVVLGVKAVLFACLLVVSWLHNFVLGPRVQAEVRAGGEQPTRRKLVVVGWISYSLTMALPVLGVVLERIVR